VEPILQGGQFAKRIPARKTRELIRTSNIGHKFSSPLGKVVQAKVVGKAKTEAAGDGFREGVLCAISGAPHQMDAPREGMVIA
jgi:hypothetical protein